MSGISFEAYQPTFKQSSGTTLKTETVASTPGSKNNKKFGKGTQMAIIGTGLAALAAVGIYLATKHKANPAILDKSKIEYIIEKNGTKVEEYVGSIEERIERIFGKDSGIKPHNYDLSKEFDTIAVYRNFGGYKDGYATTKGMINSNGGNLDIYHVRMNSEIALVNGKKETIGIVNQGTLPGYDNKVVQITIPKSNYRITVSSPDKELTPLQKDIIKLAENPEHFNTSFLDKLTEFRPGNLPNGEIDYENVGKYAHLDYDVILSAIQSMAKDIIK